MFFFILTDDLYFTDEEGIGIFKKIITYLEYYETARIEKTNLKII